MATYKLVDSEKLDADLTTVADAIRAKTGGEDPLSFPEGMAGEMDAVFEAGKKAENNDFWDEYQNFGKRGNYVGGFSGLGWTEKTFKPKYNIVVETACDQMFRGAGIINLSKALENSGVILDVSRSTSMVNLFSDNNIIENIPIISAISAKSLNYLFFGCSNLKSIEKVILKNDGLQTLSNFARNCYALENILFEGCIGSSIEFKESTLLSKNSIISIINALSTSTSGITVTLSLTAVNTAFQTSPGAADGSTSAEWATLIATKPNWTISLV